MARKLISSFNGGEMSPLLDARLDSERALNGCRTLKNFIPKPQGGAIFRPPTEYLGSTKSDAKARLIPFNFSTSTRFVIELTNLKARFWSNGALVQSGGSALEVTTPWPESALFAIQHFQENDIIWLTHPDYAPHKLIRIADNNWQLSQFEPDWPPILYDDYVEAQAAGKKDPNAVLSVSLGATSTTSGINNCQEFYLVTTQGTFTGTIQVQRKEADRADGTGGTWATVTTLTNSTGTDEYDRYTGEALPGEIEGSTVWLRLIVTRTSGTGTAKIYRVSYPGGKIATTTVTPIFWDSSSGVTTGLAGEYIELRANARLWKSNMVGTVIQLAQTRTNAKLSRTLSSSGTSATNLRMSGQWVISTVGTWYGTIAVEVQDPLTSEWEVERFWDSSGNRNISDTGEVSGMRNVRLKFTVASGTPSGSPTAYLQPVEARALSLVKIDTVFAIPGDASSSNSGPEGYLLHYFQCRALVLQDVYLETATYHFDESAWSNANGYPRTVVKHEQRICFASTQKRPQTLWLSEINEPKNFTLGSLDTSPLEVTLDSNNFNAIHWLLSQREGLAIGTSGDEWIVNSGDGNKAITPTSIQARRQSYFGSSAIRAESGDDVALFVQRGATKVREFTYTFERDQFAAIDLSVFSEHVLRTGVVQTAFASQPDGSLWCVCGDGSVAVLAYERTQQVVAWWRFITDGSVESVAVVYGGDGLADEVWLSVKRTINGSTKRYVERIPSDWWSKLNDGDMSGMCYADCRITKNLTGTTTSVTGLSHLEGKTVWATCNGIIKGSFTVTSGAITVPSTTGTQAWKIGLPYEGILKPMRSEMQLQSGSAQGRRWRVSAIEVFIWNTYAAMFRHGATGSYDTLPVQTACDPLGTTDTLQTGIVPCYVDSAHLYGLDLEIKATGPLPTNILAIVPTFEVYG